MTTPQDAGTMESTGTAGTDSDSTMASTTPEPKTFSQEDLNRIAAQARRDERDKYQDYEKLKERAAKADELEQEKLTEVEKLQRERDEAIAKATAADSRIAEMAVKTTIQMQAVMKGIVDPEAAVALINRDGIEYQDGQVIGVDSALDALLEAKPYLKGAVPGAPNLNSGNNRPSEAPIRLTDDQREYARRYNISEEQYAKALGNPNQ